MEKDETTDAGDYGGAGNIVCKLLDGYLSSAQNLP